MDDAIGCDLGLIGEERLDAYRQKMGALDAGYAVLRSHRAKANDAASKGLPVAKDGPTRSALEYLSIPHVNVPALMQVFPMIVDLPIEVLSQISEEAIYTNYLDRRSADVERLKKAESTQIPADFVFDNIAGLSTEVKHKLLETRPVSIAAAAKIEGMTPAALNAVIFALRQRSQTSAANLA